MALDPGTRFGPYKITEQIGSGGMGEVYRATDTKLGRDIAIKTLPASLAEDPDRLSRFEREAKLLAALNHPYIAAVHSLDEHEGTLYIAMELVEGETLEEKLKAGALPVEDALRLALQIAEALEAAHSKGVIHRDLKPANVMVSPDGIVKVLDFGLAKAFSEDASDANAAQSPALSVAMTQQGLVLGTAGYMSPEQASGQPTDQRADIWAFGVVLYEMLTGLPLFSGESVPHILADVLKTNPDWTRLPKTLHSRVKLMLERCLTKKPRNRYHSIADARVDIESVLGDPDAFTESAQHEPETARATTSVAERVVVASVSIAVAGLVAGLIWWVFGSGSVTSPVIRFAYDPTIEFSSGVNGNLISVSPDGRRFVLNMEDGLYIREIDELEARFIPGTELFRRSPFFSPDGQSIAYRSSNGQLNRIAISGGAPVLITDDIEEMYGASWTVNDAILFGQSDGIYEVSANSGTPEPIIAARDGEVLASPELLPDGEHVLFSSRPGPDWDSANIVVESLATQERQVLIQGGSNATYVASGHLVYALGSDLYGQAFDADTLMVSGRPVPLVQGLNRAQRSDSANYGVSDDGTLVYISGSVTGGLRTLVWVDLEGKEEPINVPPRTYRYAEISPDGTRLALDIRDQDNDLWIWNLERENLQRMTFDPGLNRGTVWSPDGERVAFSRQIGSTEEIYWQTADGSGVPEQITDQSPDGMWPIQITPDGSALLYEDVSAPRDIWIADIASAPSQGQLLLSTPYDEQNPAVSPDGRWIAFQSDESGSQQVYVRPFPEVETGLWQISTDGGTRPHWSRDGRELFYFTSQSGMSAVYVVSNDSETGFSPSAPSAVIEGPYLETNEGPDVFDVSPDGQRFLMIKEILSVNDGDAPKVVAVWNWIEELKQLIPQD